MGKSAAEYVAQQLNLESVKRQDPNVSGGKAKPQGRKAARQLPDRPAELMGVRLPKRS
jgi:hypothetical protein